MVDNSKTKELWNKGSNEYYKKSYRDSKLERIIEDPSCAFPKNTFEMIKKSLPDLKGKRICVPSSGDNIAVFALHLMGARVTSTDISEEQIKNARCIAEHHGWDIEFLVKDSMELGGIGDNKYDMVYTSNGVHVWISDLKMMYDNFNRVLKDGGFYIMFETHPFIRPFDDSSESITVLKPYEDIGPHRDVPNYHWRIQDIINNLISSGLSIGEMAEFHPEKEDISDHCWWYRTEAEAREDNYKKFDWKQNPWAVLPQWIGICAQK